MYLRRCPLTQGENFTKIDGLTARVGTIDDIERRVDKIINGVPITRVSDISRLDIVDAPVFAAISPLAKDLTTHMGKGLTHRTARVSAIMEAVERVSAEIVPQDAFNSSYGAQVESEIYCVDPQRFDLPASTTYQPTVPFNWVEGWDLVNKRVVRVPEDLCKSPSDQGILDQVDTNGLASGASFGEAIRHALLEIIERDAISQHQFFDLFGDIGQKPPSKMRINMGSLPESCADFVQRVIGANIRIVLEDITTDVGIPVVACTLIDGSYPTASGPSQILFGGWGADLQIEIAIIRAISEAHQSRVGTIQGARDSFNLTQQTYRAFTTQRRQTVVQSEPEYGVEFGYDFVSDDISKDVDVLVERLLAIGVDQIVVIDMTNPAIGIPVVRLRVPGLSVFTVDRRRIGWRCMRHIL